MRAWLSALSAPVAAIHFSPLTPLIDQADNKLVTIEGGAFEKLVGHLYEERSRKGIGDFPLSARVRGYWDKKDTEIDLVAIDESVPRLRFGTCKRDEGGLFSSARDLNTHIATFLKAYPKYAGWKIERAAIAPALSTDARNALERDGCVAQDLGDLLEGLAPVSQG